MWSELYSSESRGGWKPASFLARATPASDYSIDGISISALIRAPPTPIFLPSGYLHFIRSTNRGAGLSILNSRPGCWLKFWDDPENRPWRYRRVPGAADHRRSSIESLLYRMIIDSLRRNSPDRRECRFKLRCLYEWMERLNFHVLFLLEPRFFNDRSTESSSTKNQKYKKIRNIAGCSHKKRLRVKFNYQTSV